MSIKEPIQEKVEKAEEKARKTSSSKGEKLFDLLTYGGIAGIGTFILTIPIAYSIKYGKGAKYYEKSVKFMTDNGATPRIAEEIAMTSAAMQGGNIALLPVKLAENYKPQIVEKLNNLTGDKSGKASVDEDPKQTWPSLIKSRALAWLATFVGFRTAGSILGQERFERFEKGFARRVCDFIKKPTHINGVESVHFRYARIGAIDIFATAAATTVLYLGSRFFAKNNEHWNPKAIPPATPEAAPAQAPLAEEKPEKRYTTTIQPKTAALATPKLQNGYGESVSTQKLENAGPVLSA